MFCVIRCPSCGNVQGSSYPIKTSGCQHCGKRINIEKIGIIGSFEDQEKMREFIREIKWKGGEDLASEVSDFMTNEPKGNRPKTRSKTAVRSEMINIISEGEISINDLLNRMREKGFEEDLTESILTDLHKAGTIYHPKLNTVKMV